ncbi:hypothetical protein [Saccharomonospora piscinae]|uniref:Uncharacterized protein n=1 Tax=Saccharomonospora piscinae TaxID=687388 RepID=A0A1V9A211_SACPI|nr:hypothetical protein [Saccharomonospora piscinae]OQO91088.1 hypothetical protein B1813_16485 [Saccharomonospora piscinae]TLW93787.1 hypothetical protein FFT09_10525 [Saccharomonospora piscinae]
MSVRGSRAVRAGAVQRRSAARMSPKALYARPMALRQLYTDAGTLMRRGQREAAAAHQQNSR